MKINADLTKRAVVDASTLDWVASPMPGVDRRMLERDGEEVARVTSVVRYAPNSRFSRHGHTGGEEFLVLEGVFSDDYGDFPAGTYVRNPVGSAHTPHTDPGCTILVKLWWMHPGDQEFTRVDTTDESLWQPTGNAGVEFMPLRTYGAEETALFRLAPDAMMPERALAGGEEIFVLEGGITDASGHHGPHSWLRHPIGVGPASRAGVSGARLYVKRGHLAALPPAPPVR